MSIGYEIFMNIVRWAVTAFFSFLIAHNVITDQLAGQVNKERIAALATPIVLSLLWGCWQKIRAHFAINVALALPKGSDKDQVSDVIKKSSNSDILFLSPSQQIVNQVHSES